jgi:flagellar hook-associated protein 1
MGVGRLLDISVRTMQAYQSAMDVASNNISNASNTDYTRQKVVMSTEVGEQGSGIGVKIADVIRVRSDILDQQIRKYQSGLSDSTTRSDVMAKIETLINEPSEQGLATYLTEFYNSWDELSTNPTSTQLRSSVIQKAQLVGQKITDTINGLSDIQSSLQLQANQDVNEINIHLKSIFDLNQQIYDAQMRGDKGNELQDQRDAEIDKLSKIVNISVSKNQQGATLVNVGGIFGADQTSCNQFQLNIINGQMRLVSKNDTSAPAVVTGGDFNAVSDLFSNKTVSYKSKYEALANNFVDSVNALHMTGFSLASSGSVTGIPFFGQLDAGGNIVNAFVNGQINVNSDIIDDPNLIAISSTTGNDGNGNIANGIANLMTKKMVGLNNQTISENYSAIIGEIGTAKNVADNSVTSTELVMQNLNSQKSSTSGVNLDEEMTNIMQYQRAFEAASKMIKVADEIMQTILNLV